MALIWLSVVTALAALSAAQMARRKRRPVGQWVWCVILASPTLLLLLILPKKPVAEDSARSTIENCEACGGLVSMAAPVCPHCGHPRTKTTKRPWYAIPLEAAGTIAVTASLAAFGLGIIESNRAGFPRCDSNMAQNDVNSAISNAPLGRVNGISIVDYENVNTVSSDKGSEECHATVVLSNGNKTGISFRFYNSNNQMMVNAKLDE